MSEGIQKLSDTIEQIAELAGIPKEDPQKPADAMPAKPAPVPHVATSPQLPTTKTPQPPKFVRGPGIELHDAEISLLTQPQIHAMLNGICPMCPRNQGRATTMYYEMAAVHAEQRGKASPYDYAAAEGDPGRPDQRDNIKKVQQMVADRVPAPMADQDRFNGIVGKVQMGASFLGAVTGGKLPEDSEPVKDRLNLCEYGGVLCPNCNEYAYYDPTTQEFSCVDDTELGYMGKACGWSTTMEEVLKHPPNPCPFLDATQPGKLFCNECKCPKIGKAELKTKARMAKAYCPRSARDENGNTTKMGAWYISKSRAAALGKSKEKIDG